MANDFKMIFNHGEIERIAKIIGDDDFGLTDSEIGNILDRIGIKDVDPKNTKWKRLFNAFAEAYNKRKSGNHILSFISNAFEPEGFVGGRDRYLKLLEQLNAVLTLHNFEFQDDGKYHKLNRVETATETEKRAERLRDTLKERNLHPKVFEYCRSELLENNFFHAVLEASKGVAEMIRNKTGLKSDGEELVDSAFGGSNPILIINSFSNEAGESEQKGFTYLLKGLFGTFRNPTTHALRIEWNMSDQDALDLFSFVSYAFRRIDAATKKIK